LLYLGMLSGVVVLLGEWAPVPDWLLSLAAMCMVIATVGVSVAVWRLARASEVGWFVAFRRSVWQAGRFLVDLLP
jgi:hypothetical protein